MILYLSEEKLKYPGGRPVVIAERPKVQSTVASVGEYEAVKSMDLELSPRQKLEQAIENDPNDVSNYLELADLLAGSERSEKRKLYYIVESRFVVSTVR